MTSESRKKTESVESIRDDAYKLAFPQVKVKDPLSEVTRKERRSLLAVSIVALVVVKVGLLPEEITALGIKFATHDKASLLHLLVYVVGFYLLAFVIYALSDFITWRLSFVAELKNLFMQSNDRNYDRNQDQRIKYLEYRWNLISTPTSVVRAIFEFLVPIAIAFYSIVSLLSYEVQ
jgi:hypothetical protein